MSSRPECPWCLERTCYKECTPPWGMRKQIDSLRAQLAESSNVQVHLEEQIQVLLAQLTEAQKEISRLEDVVIIRNCDLAEAQAKAQALDRLEDLLSKHQHNPGVFAITEAYLKERKP